MTDSLSRRICRRTLIEIEALPRRGLRRVFGFHPWHVPPLRRKPYIHDGAQALNDRPAERRRSAVDIGCGLGDLSRRLDYDDVLGLDIEPEVLRGARFLDRRRAATRYEEFDFATDRVAGTYDAVVLVNWIHSIPPDELAVRIADLYREHLHPGGAILIDTVEDPEYRYNHDVGQLTAGLGATIKTLGPYARGRRLHLIEKSL